MLVQEIFPHQKTLKLQAHHHKTVFNESKKTLSGTKSREPFKKAVQVTAVLVCLKCLLENIITDCQIKTGEISNWAVFPVLETIQVTVLTEGEVVY